MRWIPLAGLCAAIVLCLLPATPSAEPGDGATTLALVDEDPITTYDLEEVLALQKRPKQGAPEVLYLTADGLLQRLIQNRLLEQEGYRMGADEERQVRNQIWEFTRHRAMLALLDSVTADVPDVGAHVGPMLEQENVMFRVSHILVADEDAARSILDELTAGADFGDLVQRYSIDSTTVDRAGDLGWARADLYIPAFQEALEGKKEGDLAGPVQSDRGWHVLKLADVRRETVGQSAAMKEELRKAAKRDRVMKTVRAYVESLKEKYGLVLDQELLASLDYGSEDPEVSAQLKRSDAVLATLPWRELTVAEFTRQMRFEHYHGLKGKPNAGEIRDETFDEWITELILRHEASVQGFDRKPWIVDAARRMERELVREQVVNTILDFDFQPTSQEIEEYYRQHLPDFTPVPRVRVDGVHLQDEVSSRAFREALESGAKVGWLASRSPGVVDPDPAAFADWVEIRSLGMVVPPEAGAIVGPLEADGKWTVVQVMELEAISPLPLDECIRDVVAFMKRERMQTAMADAVAQLEASAEIEVLPGAHDTIDARIQLWIGETPASSAP